MDFNKPVCFVVFRRLVGGSSGITALHVDSKAIDLFIRECRGQNKRASIICGITIVRKSRAMVEHSLTVRLLFGAIGAGTMIGGGAN